MAIQLSFPSSYPGPSRLLRLVRILGHFFVLVTGIVSTLTSRAQNSPAVTILGIVSLAVEFLLSLHEELTKRHHASASEEDTKLLDRRSQPMAAEAGRAYERLEDGLGGTANNLERSHRQLIKPLAFSASVKHQPSSPYPRPLSPLPTPPSTDDSSLSPSPLSPLAPSPSRQNEDHPLSALVPPSLSPPSHAPQNEQSTVPQFLPSQQHLAFAFLNDHKTDERLLSSPSATPVHQDDLLNSVPPFDEHPDEHPSPPLGSPSPLSPEGTMWHSEPSAVPDHDSDPSKLPKDNSFTVLSSDGIEAKASFVNQNFHSLRKRQIPFKVVLQNHVQRAGSRLEYNHAFHGDQHNGFWESVVDLDNQEYGRGRGPTKRSAQEEAARVAWRALNDNL